MKYLLFTIDLVMSGKNSMEANVEATLSLGNVETICDQDQLIIPGGKACPNAVISRERQVDHRFPLFFGIICNF